MRKVFLSLCSCVTMCQTVDISYAEGCLHNNDKYQLKHDGAEKNIKIL